MGLILSSLGVYFAAVVWVAVSIALVMIMLVRLSTQIIRAIKPAAKIVRTYDQAVARARPSLLRWLLTADPL